MIRRVVIAIGTTAMVVGMTAGAARAGEVTGNGRLLHVENSRWGTGLHARSFCAYSGQEDLQFFTDDGDGTAKPATKGNPGHAQSWGQVPKAVRDSFPAEFHPGISCNPNKSTFGEP